MRMPQPIKGSHYDLNNSAGFPVAQKMTPYDGEYFNGHRPVNARPP